MLKKVLSVLLAVVAGLAVGAAACGYLYINHLWIFKEPEPTVGFPAELTLHGAAEVTDPALHYAVCPSIIRDKTYYTPEAVSFPAGYFYYWDKDLDTDISEDVVEGEVPLLLQWDKRWGYKLYGTNYMGNNGCGPTALAIVYAGLTGSSEWDPFEIAEFSIQHDLYVPNIGTKWKLLEDWAHYVGLNVTNYYTQEKLIYEKLHEGEIMIAHVSKGDFTSGGHFIVICGIDENDRLTVRDPNSHETSAQLWDFTRVFEQASNFWGYTL